MAQALHALSESLAHAEQTVLEARRDLQDDPHEDPRVPLSPASTRQVCEQLQEVADRLTLARRSFLIESIRAARAAGQTTTSIASSLGISRTRVYQILNNEPA